MESNPQLKAFIELVVADERLQRQLRDLSDKKDFVTRVVMLAAESGHEFSLADIEEAMSLNRKVWLKT